MQFQSQVLTNTEVSPGYFRMRMSAPPAVLQSVSGQFVMVKVSRAIDPLLRRPFGIYDMGTFTTPYTDCGQQTFLEILYKVVGRGTAMLAELHQGDHLDIIAPLGRGFDHGAEGEEKILIGGGVGLAPLYLLAKELVKSHKVRLFAGGRSKDDILCITEFERLGVETYVATDDGTLGDRGLVTQVMMKHLASGGAPKRLFACGPMPMLRAVAGIAEEMQVPCQVSLEAYMACGMGACLGCVVKGANHSSETPDFRCVCKDGPTFDSTELSWEA